mgnify:CR=1 FL=1
MANFNELFTALERADAAGNVGDARAIAAMIRQMQEEERPKTTIGGYAKEALKAVPRGLVGGLESAALGAAALLPGDTQEGFREDCPRRNQRICRTPETHRGCRVRRHYSR